MHDLLPSNGVAKSRAIVAWLEWVAVKPKALAVLLAGHVAAWTVYAIVAQSSGVVHHDMSEAWSWGQEFELGYYKHPPLFAWIAGLWFHVLPRQDWAFYLLSAVNAALGLAGVWVLAGRFLAPFARLAAVLALALTPFHNFLAVNYNANSILLSVWPWTTYFFMRAIETGRLVDGCLFGVLAGLALLSKFYSGLLLASCLVAALLHPEARRIFRSPAPYAAVVVALLVFSPHLVWAFKHNLQSFGYLAGKPKFPWIVLLQKSLNTALACIAFQSLAVIAWRVAYGRQGPTLLRLAVQRMVARNELWIGVLTLGPAVLTLAAGVVGGVKISSNFVIPAFFMLPIAVLKLSEAGATPAHLRIFGGFVAGLGAVALLAAPAIALITFQQGVDLARAPRRELAQAVTDAWRDAFGTRLSIAAGSDYYGLGLAFYSSDSPSEFTQLRYSFSPWITPERLAREGFAIACLDSDRNCVEKATRLVTSQTRHANFTFTRRFMGLTGDTTAFKIFLIPPGPIPSVEPMR
jgi:hypothetical protein